MHFFHARKLCFDNGLELFLSMIRISLTFSYIDILAIRWYWHDLTTSGISIVLIIKIYNLTLEYIATKQDWKSRPNSEIQENIRKYKKNTRKSIKSQENTKKMEENKKGIILIGSEAVEIRTIIDNWKKEIRKIEWQYFV